jgi:monooxygenase
MIHPPKVLHKAVRWCDPGGNADRTGRPIGSTVTSTSDPTAPEHVDVLIVGAGLSGIGAACHLQTEAPGVSYAILEARGASGGTWDLFRFPGVRSDSDMYTLGFRFRPWTDAQAIAPGGDILKYLRETAAAYGIDKDIEYHSKVAGADWSSSDARWTVTVEHTGTGEVTQRTANFLYLCSGYFRYDQGYTPTWPGQDDFTGTIVHPQFWPEDLDYTGKKVVVIGSGATAVTLVPAMAGTAAKVTMLQRSPSFIMSLPGADPIADLLHKVLPGKQAFAAVRWKNARIGTAIYNLSRKYPKRAREVLQKGAAKQLPAGYDMGKHFTPAYQPWDQRLCLVPDGDFFKSIKSGRAEVVTDHIEAFTPTGIRLTSGTELEADVIVTATGLNLQPLGGIGLTVDGEPVPVGERMAYKAMMLEGVPNMAFAIGYTNASWTLKVDMVSSYMARIAALMKQQGYATVTPRPSTRMSTSPLIEMTSGYFARSRDTLPLQGTRAPWRVRQHYFKDSALFRGAVDEKELQFQRAPARMEPAR